MNNADFWASLRSIIAKGFTPEGLHKLDSYAEQFANYGDKTCPSDSVLYLQTGQDLWLIHAVMQVTRYFD